jgi:hypothetical protein
MPELARVLTEEDIRARGPMRMDLTPYLAIVDEVAGGGVGGELTLDEDENQRATKRRMSLAAKERGYDLTWRKSRDRELRFVLARPGEPRPGGRPRRSPAERQMEALGGEGVMATEADAAAATTPRTRASSGGRGRQTARRGRS